MVVTNIGIAEAKINTAPGEVRHFDHFALPTTSIDRSEKFYAEVLGLRTIVKGAPRIPGGIFMKIGTQHHLGFFEQRPVNTGFMPKRDNVDGFPRVAFAVPASAFDATVKRIGSACAIVEEIHEANLSGAENGLAFVDPEGNIMELFRSGTNPSLTASHFHFETTALAEAVDFYTAVMNFSVTHRSADCAVLAIPTGQALVLHAVQELSVATKTYFDGRHFAFSVTDENFHAIVAKLEQRGLKQADNLGGNAHRKPGDLGTYFQDPTNGMHIQMLNSDSSEFSKQFAS
jgi:catechol 2,3-dioxygenase-like lactoylglutathione lyase family enzyme